MLTEPDCAPVTTAAMVSTSAQCAAGAKSPNPSPSPSLGASSRPGQEPAWGERRGVRGRARRGSAWQEVVQLSWCSSCPELWGSPKSRLALTTAGRCTLARRGAPGAWSAASRAVRGHADICETLSWPVCCMPACETRRAAGGRAAMFAAISFKRGRARTQRLIRRLVMVLCIDYLHQGGTARQIGGRSSRRPCCASVVVFCFLAKLQLAKTGARPVVCSSTPLHHPGSRRTHAGLLQGVLDNMLSF